MTHELEIERLRGELMRTRARLVARESLLAWEREERLQLQRTLERWGLKGMSGASGASLVDESVTEDITGMAAARLESSLHAADLVICQTGCVSHDSFWRVEDHCKRTGKACVLIERPEALRIVRVHPSGETEQLATSFWNDKEIKEIT
ncbi:DUF2325 domain-containing protein [Diaphorobacter caeni]|uniref:DUF2325 domain-containing protein n=1 Tax=Diaphorobacter caeni TaxID=2784387 RepID=UPI00188E97D2|nr:DUF2325 domain-containing protein [Diaphorobacter caeni]MBF5005635.1 DUF2325 domain-containing protein [Diaphorobacter caeni]